MSIRELYLFGNVFPCAAATAQHGWHWLARRRVMALDGWRGHVLRAAAERGCLRERIGRCRHGRVRGRLGDLRGNFASGGIARLDFDRAPPWPSSEGAGQPDLSLAVPRVLPVGTVGAGRVDPPAGGGISWSDKTSSDRLKWFRFGAMFTASHAVAGVRSGVVQGVNLCI